MGNRKLPFGYQMVFGRVVTHPQEAELVRHIFEQYLAGATFKSLVEELAQQSVPYDVDKPWNKNMVARILADDRYTGRKDYPQLIESEILGAALAMRSTKQVTIRQTPAQKVLRQLSDSTPTKKMEQQVLTILNRLIDDPAQVQFQTPDDENQAAALRQELDSVLSQLPINEEQTTSLAFQCAAQQYEEIGISEYETQRIRRLLEAAKPMNELDADLLRATASKIQLTADKTVCLQLKNQQTIQGV